MECAHLNAKVQGAKSRIIRHLTLGCIFAMTLPLNTPFYLFLFLYN